MGYKCAIFSFFIPLGYCTELNGHIYYLVQIFRTFQTYYLLSNDRRMNVEIIHVSKLHVPDQEYSYNLMSYNFSFSIRSERSQTMVQHVSHYLQ